MNEKIMEAMDHMDEKYVKEALGAGKKVISYKPLLRWVGISACLVLIIGLCIGFYGGQPVSTQPSGGALQSGQSTEPTQEIVLPPTRYGNTRSLASLAGNFTLHEGVAQAEVVAWVRVGNWLGENTENHAIGRTYYEVEAIEVYKGRLPERTVIKQYGSTKGTDKAFPLLTAGNELILFLNKSEDTDFGECYYIMGSYGTVMDVSHDESGTAYVTARVDAIFSSIKSTERNYANNSALMTEVGAVVAAYDEIQSEIVNHSEYMYAITDIEEILRG